MIKVKSVTKTFGDFKSLDEMTLTAKKGSVYGLIGPNGAGKTTIIKNMLGIYTPDSGSIEIMDKPVYENSALKQEVVYISDDLFFFAGYTIKALAHFYAGLYENWSWERFESLKEVFKIDVKRKVKRLSKGMQKQVAFWLGICAKPKVMILDEPVDGLDPVMRRNVWKILLQDVAENEMTVLVSSHNLRELEDVCDHVGIVHNGKVVLEKSLDDAKGNIHKIQVAFENEFPKEVEDELEVLHTESMGRVHLLIVKGDSEDIKSRLKKYNPIICDVLPLSLEEVFIYELGGMGYEFENIIL